MNPVSKFWAKLLNGFTAKLYLYGQQLDSALTLLTQFPFTEEKLFKQLRLHLDVCWLG